MAQTDVGQKVENEFKMAAIATEPRRETCLVLWERGMGECGVGHGPGGLA